MAAQYPNAALCKNIFQSGENAISAAQYTRKWIELINILEKRKGMAGQKQ